MSKVVEIAIDRFDGGIANDPRDKSENTARMITNFDIYTDPHRLIPYRDSESGAASPNDEKFQNFTLALRTGSTYSFYALGVISDASQLAEVKYKDITVGGSNDLDDTGWSSTANNQSAAASPSFNLFVYYRRTGLIYLARAGQYIMTYDPAGTAAWADSARDLGASNSFNCNGIVHSKDDILYIPYTNIIAKNDNGSWTNAALTLPTHTIITSICEYGNYLAIAAKDRSLTGKSYVYLWDRNASLATLSESIEWGEGELTVLDVVDGTLIGISRIGNVSYILDDRIVFRALIGSQAVQFKIVTSTTSIQLPNFKQRADNRLYFLMNATISGTLREGVWSIGRTNPSSPFTLVHERTPNNDTALTAGTLSGFFVVGDFMFISYVETNYVLNKTNDADSYTATSIYESKIFDFGDNSKLKKLLSVSVNFQPLPAAGQVVLGYMADAETSFTTISTNTTDDSLFNTSYNIESSGVAFPEFREIQFRIQSTGNAVPTGLRIRAQFIDLDRF